MDGGNTRLKGVARKRLLGFILVIFLWHGYAGSPVPAGTPKYRLAMCVRRDVRGADWSGLASEIQVAVHPSAIAAEYLGGGRKENLRLSGALGF